MPEHHFKMDQFLNRKFKQLRFGGSGFLVSMVFLLGKETGS